MVLGLWIGLALGGRAAAVRSRLDRIRYALAASLVVWLISLALLVGFNPTAPEPFQFIEQVVVASGMDKADDYIVERAAKGVIVVTVDVEWSSELVEGPMA